MMVSRVISKHQLTQLLLFSPHGHGLGLMYTLNSQTCRSTAFCSLQAKMKSLMEDWRNLLNHKKQVSLKAPVH